MIVVVMMMNYSSLCRESMVALLHFFNKGVDGENCVVADAVAVLHTTGFPLKIHFKIQDFKKNSRPHHRVFETPIKFSKDPHSIKK